jgi:hypothetical protein
MFGSYGLDSAAEDGMPLLQPMECAVQLRYNRVGFIRDDHHFDIDLFVKHGNTRNPIERTVSDMVSL